MKTPIIDLKGIIFRHKLRSDTWDASHTYKNITMSNFFICSYRLPDLYFCKWSRFRDPFLACEADLNFTFFSVFQTLLEFCHLHWFDHFFRFCNCLLWKFIKKFQFFGFRFLNFQISLNFWLSLVAFRIFSINRIVLIEKGFEKFRSFPVFLLFSVFRFSYFQLFNFSLVFDKFASYFRCCNCS